MAYGRGGAGNIEAANQKISDDLEAQRVAAETSTAERRTSQQPPISPTFFKPSNANQEYAYSGRGGAGNWFSPKELAQNGEFVTSPEQQPSSQPKTLEKESVADSRSRGRGGAGNFLWTAEDEERERQNNQVMEIELKEMVVKDVDRELPRPDRAFIRQWDE